MTAVRDLSPVDLSPAPPGPVVPPLFSNMVPFNSWVGHASVQRLPGVIPPPVNNSPFWTDFCGRMAGIDIGASDIGDLNGLRRLSIDMARIVVLPVYHAVLSHATKSPLLPDNTVNMVIGQHGTGKSAMALVIMIVLMALNRPFIYSRKDDTDECYYYWDSVNGAVVCGTIDKHSSAFSDRSVTWLMDQRPHGCWNSFECRCRIVLFVSQNFEQNRSFTDFNINYNRVNLPLPTRADCDAVALAHGIINHVERIELFGPILRIVTARNFLEFDQELNEALHECSFDVNPNSPVDFVGGKKFGHRIFYTDGDRINFVNSFRRFGSKYIQDRYNHEWNRRKFTSLSSFLHLQSPALVGLQGPVFESYAHDVLKGGLVDAKACQLHPLQSYGNIAATVNIPKGRLNKIAGFATVREEILVHNRSENLATIANAGNARPSGAYIRAKATNMGAVDALVLDPIPGIAADLYQMTVSLNHGMNCDELAALITRIDAYHVAHQAPANQPIRLFYVVPYFICEDFQRQTYRNLATSNLTQQQLDRVVMYSLGVDGGLSAYRTSI